MAARFQQWRKTRQGNAAIPDELWAAAEVARRDGVTRTAEALHLDGGKLRRRMVNADSVSSKGMAPAGVSRALWDALMARRPRPGISSRGKARGLGGTMPRRFEHRVCVSSGAPLSRQVQLCRKKFEPAIHEFRQMIPPSGYGDAPAPALATLAYALGSASYRAEAAEVSRALESRMCYVSPYDVAIASLGVELAKQALELLEQAYRDRSRRVTRINVEPWFAPIRAGRSFQKLVRVMKLE